MSTFLFHTDAGDLRGHERLDRRSGDQNVDRIERDFLHIFFRHGFQDQGLRGGYLAERRARLVHELDHSGVFGVIGDARPVERRVDLDVVAERMLDRLALEVLVGVGRGGMDVADGERVERPARVDVGFAEVGVALRIGLRCGSLGRGRLLSCVAASDFFCAAVSDSFFWQAPSTRSAMTATVAARRRDLIMEALL